MADLPARPGTFLSITLHYLPLHIQQTGEHVFLPPGRRLLYILATAPRLGGYARLGALALVGSVLIDRHLKREPRRRLLFRVAFALMAVYALTPALSGQFWDYHFDPFEFWLIAVLSLLVLPIGAGSGTGVLAALLLVAALSDSARRHHVIDPGPAKGGLVAEMAATIEKYVPAGAPIQTLDWTSGADHALLRTGHPIGTRFLYDYHFYHHVGTPVVQALQRTFIAELVACRVPFILEVKRPYKDAVSGLGTSNHFEALETILGDRYELAHDASVYRLLRLKATYAGPAGDAAAGCDVAPPSRRGDSPRKINLRPVIGGEIGLKRRCMDPADAGIVIPGFAAWASLKHRNGGGHEQRAVWCQTIELDEDGQQAMPASSFGWFSRHSARALATSGRSCSAARSDFF